MAAKFCPQCGESVDDADTYCPQCGTSLDPQKERVGAKPDPAQPADESFVEEGDTTIAALTHILALFTWVIGPIIILVASDDAFVKENARNALNWQIMLTIYMIISGILILLLVGFFLVFIFAILDLIFCIVAAVKAADGDAWKYPITLDLI